MSLREVSLSHPSRAAASLGIVTLFVLLLPTAGPARARDLQLTPNGGPVLVNKDVGSDRFALALHADGTATGNVFRTNGDDPAFLFCEPTGTDAFACFGAEPCRDDSRLSGIQRSPDGRHILVNKDVGAERFAIELHADGTATGSVYRADGGTAAFLYCTPVGTPHAFACFGAEACRTSACTDQYVALGTVTLPADFFAFPASCDDSFRPIGDVTLPPGFFRPDDDDDDDNDNDDNDDNDNDNDNDNDTRCCLPDGSGTECEDRTTAECVAQGGVDLGPGSCTPNPCASIVPPGGNTGRVRVRCERRSDRSKISVDGRNLAAGTYTAQAVAGAHAVTAAPRSSSGDEVEFDFDSDRGDIAEGATPIPATFIPADTLSVTGRILDASGTVVAETTTACEVRQ